MAATKKSAKQAAAKTVKVKGKAAGKAEAKKNSATRVLDAGKGAVETVKTATKRLRADAEDKRNETRRKARADKLAGMTPQERKAMHQRLNETLVSFRLEREDVAALDVIAKALGVTRSAAARLAVQHLIDSFEKSAKTWTRRLAA